MPALVIDGHPHPASLTAALAARYAESFGDARLLAVRDLDFDADLHGGLRAAQPLEPDLVDAAHALVAADHIVVAAPVWWGSVPARLKGFFDRVLQRRWAYEYRGRIPHGRLGGRSGRLIVTSDSPWLYLHTVGDSTVHQVREATLRFVGLKPVRLSRFTSVRTSDAPRRERWLEQVARDAHADARLVSRRTRPRDDPGPLLGTPVRPIAAG